MARTLIESEIKSHAARARLAIGGGPYWRSLNTELALGWHKGRWIVRRYIPGEDGRRGQYKQWTLRQLADDWTKADGVRVLSFDQAADLAAEAVKKADAQDKAEVEKAEMEAEAQKAAQAAKLVMTVQQACEDYVENHLRVKRKSSYNVDLTFKRHVYPALGAREVRSLTKSDLESWLRGVAARSSQGNANRVLALLRAGLSYAYRDEANEIPSDRAWRTVEPFKARPRSRCDEYLDPSEVARLLAVMTGGLYNLTKGAFLTGMRPPHELAGIRASDFKTKRGIVEVARSKVGDKRDAVTLSSEAVEFFTELAQGKAPDDLLFVQDNGRPWIIGEDGNRRGIYHSEPFAQAVIAAGLPAKTTIYVMRHSHISLALNSPDCDILLLAKNCGTSVEMIERYYGKYREADRQRKVEEMSPRLGLRIVA